MTRRPPRSRSKSGHPAIARAPATGFVPLELRLHSAGGDTFDIRHTRDMRRAAMEWSYVLLNRKRWAETQSTKEEIADRSRRLLSELGVGTAALRAIAEAKVVEVEIPWQGEADGWESRLLPWEFLLGSATKRWRGKDALTVVRWLKTPDRGGPASAPKKVLYVESAPGELADLITFDTERSLVRSGLGIGAESLRNPDRNRLARAVTTGRPDVVHLAGVDNHQGDEMGVIESSTPVLDGFVLSSAGNRPAACDAETLATLLAAGGHRARLVAANLYRSAARTAPLAVAAGARAAIGFQDVIDDTSAEVFWSNFYRAWRISKWDLLSAFVVARLVLRDQPQTQQGNGIVLWSDISLIGAAPAVRGAKAAAPGRAVQQTFDDERSRLEQNKLQLVTPASLAGKPDRELVKFTVEAVPTLNYSLLHNDRPLFTTFKLDKQVEGRMQGVNIEVTMDAGPQTIRYNESFDLTEAAYRLESQIRLPLTSTLLRSLTEPVRTNLGVSVKWGERVLRLESIPIRLLPIDEWEDTDTDRMWLPSFVQPRDPAVLQIIESAHRYLAAITDSLGAGFDGYQSHDPDADDPDLGIDLQVQAMWTAILQDFQLHYINPPPSSTTLSQRLRSPSEVVRGHQGTCIDLALLLCACLEHVDIYPAIILLDDHAFPAYWRSEAAHDRFQTARPPMSVSRGVPQASDAVSGQYSWHLQQRRPGRNDHPGAYGELLQRVQKNDLVPIETVCLTDGTSFAEAIEEGVKNLRSQTHFDSMIDIVTARQQGVTPLPVVRSE